MRIVLVVLAACATPVAKPQPNAERWMYRQLLVGAHARRVTFVLAFDGDRATLVETSEHAANAEAPWTAAPAVTYVGTRAGELLELAAPNVQPLRLRCRTLPVDVLAATAHHDAACAWQPAATTRVDALVCAPPDEQATPDGDDDDRLVFLRDGLEHISERGGCSGLRALR